MLAEVRPPILRLTGEKVEDLRSEKLRDALATRFEKKSAVAKRKLEADRI